MRPLGRLLAAAALGWVLAAGPVLAGDEISVAERAIFLDEHLKGIDGSSDLHYDFRHSEDAKPDFDDSVTVSVRSDAARGRVVTAEFLHGEQALSLPEVQHAEANPVVLYFLERDVREMRRLLGGMESYFRKRIRMALANDARIEPVEFSYRGRSCKGSRIEVTPYVGDPNGGRFRGLDGKRYLFTLSGDVPGGIYELRTVVAPAEGRQGPRIEDVLTLAGDGA